MATNGSRPSGLRRPHEGDRTARGERHRPARADRPRRHDRPVLDQAIAINGELRVKLLGLNVLPIQVRLLVSSKEVAAELGLDWWRKNRERPSRDDAKKKRHPM